MTQTTIYVNFLWGDIARLAIIKEPDQVIWILTSSVRLGVTCSYIVVCLQLNNPRNKTHVVVVQALHFTLLQLTVMSIFSECRTRPNEGFTHLKSELRA